MTTLITTRLMRQIAPGIGADAAANWAAALEAARLNAGITTRREVNHWLAQLAHESSAFSAFEENLNYSAARLRAVWPRRFPSAAAAAPFARNPRALANKVYNGRMGNRDDSNDGWYFRGRGPKQLTGRSNYTAFQAWLRSQNLQIDVIMNPDLLTTPRVGALSAAWFWAANDLSSLLRGIADEKAAGTALTKRINGGTIGLNERLNWLTRISGMVA